jgi:hypothetical protein
MTGKQRYDYDALKKICNENNIELLEDYNNVKVNRETRIKGKCKTEFCKESFDKSFRRLVENSYCSGCSIKISRENTKQTCIEKYGCEYPSQNKEVKEKNKQTCLKKYGCEYSLQYKEVREKGKQTCIEKYGVEHPSQSEEIKEQKKTNLYRKIRL